MSTFPSTPSVPTMPDVSVWCARVAGCIGILPPSSGHERWLRLHWSEAAACMELADMEQMTHELGHIR